MAFCHLPSFSCTSKKFRSFVGPQVNTGEPRKWETHSFPSFKNPTIACSSKKSRASKQLKATRHIKSNADLCNDLREFNSMAGLPETHVPSMKELYRHGRKDLANIVRRRGYKLIAELLMNTTKVDTNMERTAENRDANNDYGNDSAEAQNKRTNVLVVDVSSSSKASMVENYFPHTNGVVAVNSDVQQCEDFESSVSSSLHKKAVAFVQTGDLEIVEGALEVEDMWMRVASDLGYGISETSGADASVVTSENADSNLNAGVVTSENADSNLNAGVVTSKEISLLTKVHTSHRDNVLPSEGLNSVDFDKDLVDEAGKSESQIEIDHLKAMLHEKELELSQLKQQIEEEKLALSILQTKARAEIGNAQKIISTKDTELYAAEESLSGLKEVQIEYWGSGEVVEVAGSFNGWDHPIKMDLHLSAETIDQAGSRKSVLWSNVLWLYPGIYEIKFIVDGHWRIDSQREFITRGNIQNNVLRVDR